MACEKPLFEGRGYGGAYEPIAIDGPFVVTHGRTLSFDLTAREPLVELGAPAVRREHDPTRA